MVSETKTNSGAPAAFLRGAWWREMVSRESWIASAKIILLVVCAAMIYGVALDEATIRISSEYFTLAHRPVFNTGSPALLALGRGVRETWWGGAMAGIIFAIAARAGSLPKATWRRFVKPLGILAAVMGASAAGAAFLGAWMAGNGTVPAVQAWALALPVGRQTAFMAVVFAHVCSYLIGALGALTIAISVAWKRYG